MSERFSYQCRCKWTGRPGQGPEPTGHGSKGCGMRRTRIEKRRRPVRARRYGDDTHAWPDALDPRDPDIVRAKRLQGEQRGGIDRP